MPQLSSILDNALLFRLREVLRKPWIRVVLFSLMGVVTASVSGYLAPVLPTNLPIELASGAVDDLLHIVATSMLAVTTFSVSIIVAAFGRAAQNATPRAITLLVADPVAQNALAVFVGSFLFSIVGIILMAAGYYHGRSRVILFLTTLVMIALIVWALLRWINHLNEFGRMNDIIDRLEDAATRAARRAAGCPRGGARPATGDLRRAGISVDAGCSGYLRHVDYPQLDEIAARAGLVVEVAHAAGHYVHEGQPLLYLSRAVDDETLRDGLAGAFAIGVQRSFDQDLRYGLIVLSEVGSRALSPAINDPGTAIDVLRAGTRVLLAHHRAAAAAGGAEPPCRHVLAPDTDMGAAYREFFGPIAREGKNLIEVQAVLQSSLAALACSGGADLARPTADTALAVALASMEDAADAAQLRARHARVADCP